MPRTIFTIGHSTRSEAETIELVRLWAIEGVVDVRRFPTSRHQQFKRERMEQWLSEAGVTYDFLGEELGGFRKGGYEAYMGTPEFAAGIEKLEAIAAERPVAVMCAEKLPWRCHRRFIGDALRERGWEVMHVIECNRTWQPSRNLSLEGM